MIRKTTYLLVGALIGAVGAVSLTQSHLLTGSAAIAAGVDTYRQLNLFGDVFERIRAKYVEAPDEAALIEAAINGMLTSLDPHSSFMNAKAYDDMQVQTQGEFGGLGIEVTMEEGLVKVVYPIEDTPAARGGVLAGDLITALDGEPVQGMALDQAVDKMRGAINTPITLTIQRAGSEKPIEIRLVREKITIQSVTSRVEDDAGYIKIKSFNEQTFDGLKSSVAKIQKEVPADRLKGYVIDLRNNPGGLLDQAIAVSDAFLDRGEIVSTRGRNADETQRFSSQPGDLVEGKPVIVLVNGGSASASEIVAGALQDHRRATIVGTRSFGKGSVQTIIPIGKGALRLTTARYYTPSGTSIQAKGIVPDIDVEQPLPPELAAAAAAQEPRGEASLKGHLNGEGEEATGSSAYVPPEAKDDKQIKYALDLLRGLQVNSAFPADPAKGVPN
jgi:carboxyl-terminal processing protease